MARFLRLVLAALLTAGGLFFAIGTAPAASAADPCTGTWSIVMGGFIWSGGQDSSYLVGDQRVGYNAYDPQGGLNELTRLFWQHRNDCPGDHIKLVGHSEGAGLVHAFVSQNQGIDNYNAVLLADPKRDPGPGGAGISGAAAFIGPPLGGTDHNFGDVPVLEVCRWDDKICNGDTDWSGYINGHHGWYDMNAYDYPDWTSDTWMQ